MAGPDIQKHMPVMAAFILPAVIVKLVTLQLAQPSPQLAVASAVASQEPAEPMPAEPRAREWSPKQIAATTYVHSLRQQTFGPPPFLFDITSTEQSEPAPVQPPSTHEPNVVTPPPTFVIGAVMSAASGQRALINGKPYREGETVKGTSWMVHKIDCGERAVTLRDIEHDRSMTINVELPQ